MNKRVLKVRLPQSVVWTGGTVLALLLCSYQGHGMNVAGTALDADGLPASGLRIALMDHAEPEESVTMSTDTDGRFAFFELPKDTYSLIVLPSESWPRSPPFYPPIMVTNNVSDLELRPDLVPHCLMGQISTADTGVTVNATVSIVPANPALASYIVLLNPSIIGYRGIDESETFQFGSVIPGEYLIGIKTTLDTIPRFNVVITDDSNVIIEEYGGVLLEQRNLVLTLWLEVCDGSAP